MKLTWENNAYDAVEKEVLAKYEHAGTLVVQLRKKYGYDDEWEECTELLLNDGDCWFNPRYVWENDWWEGEDDVELIAAAPIWQVKLGDEWRI